MSHFLPSGLHSAICFYEWLEPAETQIYVWVCVSLCVHVRSGLCLIRMSLGCWCASLELWKTVVADIWLAVMHEYDQTVTQSCWPNVIRDSNDDGGSAHSEETEITLWAAGEWICKLFGKGLSEYPGCVMRRDHFLAHMHMHHYWAHKTCLHTHTHIPSVKHSVRRPKGVGMLHPDWPGVHRWENKQRFCATECNTINAVQKRLSKSVHRYPCIWTIIVSFHPAFK